MSLPRLQHYSLKNHQIQQLRHHSGNRKQSIAAQYKKVAEQHLLNHHGIERNKLIYIELRCSFHAYPHHDEYVNDVLPVNDILLLRHIDRTRGFTLHYLTILQSQTPIPILCIFDGTICHTSDSGPHFIVEIIVLASHSRRIVAQKNVPKKF